MLQRDAASRISHIATDLAFSALDRIVAMVATTCGTRADLVTYIVGIAFVAAGASIMRKHASGERSSIDDALDTVRDIHKQGL